MGEPGRRPPECPFSPARLSAAQASLKGQQGQEVSGQHPLPLGNKSFNEEGAGRCIPQPTLLLPALTAVSDLYPEHIPSQWGGTVLGLFRAGPRILSKNCPLLPQPKGVSWTKLESSPETDSSPSPRVTKSWEIRGVAL